MTELEICSQLPMPANEIIHIANLLESSALVPLEELTNFNSNINDSVINFLVKHLPIYSVMFEKEKSIKCVIVNYIQTNASCDILEHAIGLKSKEAIVNAPESRKGKTDFNR